MFDAIVNFLHLIAMALWIGGAAYFHSVLIPALKTIDPPQAGKLQGAIAKRFSIVAWSSIVTLIVTGILKTPSDLMFDTTSDMGRILLVKHIFVILVVVVGLAIGLYVVPNMHKNAPQPGQAPSSEFVEYQQRLSRLATVNLILGVLTVALASMLW